MCLNEVFLCKPPFQFSSSFFSFGSEKNLRKKKSQILKPETMSTALDMSLEDIIKTNKKSSSRTRPPRSSSGPARRLPNRAANRAAPYSKPAQAPDAPWQHDMFAAAPAHPARSGRPRSVETGTKLYISNLDYGVSTEDIKELFSEVGDVKRYAVHYDRSGRSEGTAEVVYARREDAVAAVKRYNDVQLDGKPMKIEIVGSNVASQTGPAPPPGDGWFRVPNLAPRRNQRMAAPVGQPRGGGRGGRRGGGGRGRGKGRDENVSAEDLDADLEKYHSEAMQG